MLDLIQHVKDKLQGKVSPGQKRSSRWKGVRAKHLESQPHCQVCGGLKRLQVHHILPFHLHPELELDPSNLITLCEGSSSNCHLTFGHASNFRGLNANVHEDVEVWRDKFTQSKLMSAPKKIEGAEGK